MRTITIIIEIPNNTLLSTINSDPDMSSSETSLRVGGDLKFISTNKTQSRVIDGLIIANPCMTGSLRVDTRSYLKVAQ